MTQPGGTKRSAWLTFRRRLLLVRALVCGPVTRAALVAAINAELGRQGYPSAANAALTHERDARTSASHCQIRSGRATRQDLLHDLGERALRPLSGVATGRRHPSPGRVGASVGRCHGGPLSCGQAGPERVRPPPVGVNRRRPHDRHGS